MFCPSVSCCSNELVLITDYSDCMLLPALPSGVIPSGFAHVFFSLRFSHHSTGTYLHTLTHQNNLLHVSGRTPVEHSGGVVPLHVIVHCLHLIVAGDQHGLVSGDQRAEQTNKLKDIEFVLKLRQQI